MPQCAECKSLTCWTEKTKLEKVLIVSIIFTSALALAVSCAYLATILVAKEKDKEKETKSSKNDDICLTESCISSAATILENMDSKISPCEDFYNFACGNFVKKTIVPEDQEYVQTISFIKENLQKKMKYMLEEPIQTNELKPFQMIKKFYKTCMNMNLIEKDGLTTIRSILKNLGGWPVLEGDKWTESRFDWKELTYKFREIGYFDASLLCIFVKKHLSHSDWRVLYIKEPASDKKKKLNKRQWTEEEVKRAYFRYMVDAAVQFGVDRNRSESELRDVFIFDNKISDLSVSRLYRLIKKGAHGTSYVVEDFKNQTLHNFSDISVTNLQQTLPDITWMEFINQLLAPYNVTVRADERLIVNLEYLKGLESLLQTVSKRTLANYMIWRFIYYCAPFLNRAFREARLKYRQVFTGVSTFGTRWKDCLDNFMVQDDFSVQRESLFIAAGALYVRKYFSKKDKEDVQEMISSIHRSFQDTLEHIDWMDAETKKKALDKAKAMIMNTAYPDEFLDDKKLLKFYDEDIELDENNFLKSILKLNRFDIRHHFKRLREPFDRKNWIEQGQVVVANAFYLALTVFVNVPAGILEEHTFSNRRPNYLNYGAIGTIIGHEITHGFDITGRLADKNGNFLQWWTPESKISFEKKAACIAKQYSSFKLLELNMAVNGKRTLGENIADNGGFATSYKAYRKWVEKHGTEKMLPGLKYAPNQLFWISLANFWCFKSTPESLQTRVLTNVHSPHRFRVIGSLSNNEDFANDFHCSVGSKMNPKQKCKLW